MFLKFCPLSVEVIFCVIHSCSISIIHWWLIGCSSMLRPKSLVPTLTQTFWEHSHREWMGREGTLLNDNVQIIMFYVCLWENRNHPFLLCCILLCYLTKPPSQPTGNIIFAMSWDHRPGYMIFNLIILIYWRDFMINSIIWCFVDGSGILYHKCSIVLISGDWDSHGIWFTLFSCSSNHSVTTWPHQSG